MSTAVGIEAFEDYARIAGTELLIIDETTTARAFETNSEWNAAYYRLRPAESDGAGPRPAWPRRWR
jgi:L-arabinose isomerase